MSRAVIGSVIRVGLGVMAHHRKLDTFIEEARDRQKNIVFPDTTRNGRSIDAYLWRGNPDAPLVQRIGAFLFGFVCLGIGLVILSFARSDGPISDVILDVILSLASVALGIRVMANGFKRRKHKTGTS